MMRPGSTRQRKWLPLAGSLLLIGLIGVGLVPRAQPVESAAVARGQLRRTIVEEGQTRIRHRYVVSAPVAGQLRRIALQAGDDVTAGVVVAVIDSPTPILLDARTRTQAESRRDAAAAQLEAAKARVTLEEKERDRVERLFLESTASAQMLDAAKWRAIAAARDAESAAAALREAEQQLVELTRLADPQRANAELHAPTAGRVLRVFEESSRTVLAGTPLLEIGDPTDLEVVIEVLSKDGAALEAGMPVELTQWGGELPLQARIRRVEPLAFTKISALGVEEQRVNVIADLVSPLSERGALGDRFRVEAHIVTWQADDVLKVPVGALFRRGEKWNVYAIESGRSRQRQVEIGSSSGTEAEVLGGLLEAEEVVLYPGDRIEDGTRVRVAEVE